MSFVIGVIFLIENNFLKVCLFELFKVSKINCQSNQMNTTHLIQNEILKLFLYVKQVTF